MTPWFKHTLVELSIQMDLANFIQEVSHARMRKALTVAQGHSSSFATVCLQHFGAELGRHHRDLQPPPQSRPQGRPRKDRKKAIGSCNAFQG